MKRIIYVVCKFNMEVELPEDHAEDRPEVNPQIVRTSKLYTAQVYV